MEQSALPFKNKHAGWSETESNLLWETADEAQQQGLPLKQVFERIAEKTGRRPNSIRNYYYAQVRQREGENHHTARFVPFTEPEVETLVEQVLRARARGQSVRACLQELSRGDHSLMLRYQNKYRSVLKSRPELIDQTIERLRGEGVECAAVEIHPRPRNSVSQACELLSASARKVSDPELIRACDVLCRLMLSGSQNTHTAQLDRMNVRLDLYRFTMSQQQEALSQISQALAALSTHVKEFLVQSPEARIGQLDAFCSALTEQLGTLESTVSQTESMLQ